jgi:AcrR family transcriptional regulator
MKEKKNIRKAQIAENATKLFLERGYDHTAMSAIAKATGISKAHLYNYFANKEDLLFHIIKTTMHDEFNLILEAAEEISDPEERLRYFLRAYTDLLTEDGRARIIVHDARRLNSIHFSKIAIMWRRTFDLIRGTVSELQKLGKANELNKNFVAFASLGMISWTFYWFDYSRKESASELSDTYVDLLFKGLMK